MPKKNGNGLTEVNARTIISVSEQTKSSPSKQNESNPIWNEMFYFWLHHQPEHESLNIKIEDEKSKTIVASCDLNLKELLNENEMYIDKGFEMKTMFSGSGNDIPIIYMKVSLKLLTLATTIIDNENEKESLNCNQIILEEEINAKDKGLASNSKTPILPKSSSSLLNLVFFQK